MSRTVYLVGSVPLPDAASVFRTVGTVLGPRLRWLPDGETGARLDWVMWLAPIFAASEALEPSDRIFRLHPSAPPTQRYRLKPGRTVADVRFDNLGYADNALASYEAFRTAKAAGHVAPQCKFQVDLVPAHSVLWLYAEEELQAALDQPFNEAVKREIDRIVAHVPADELAIQFDVASAVFARLQREEASSYGQTKEEARESFVRIIADLANHVPADVDLLFHFCYGDANHRHVVEPVDMGDMVAMANRLAQEVRRPIQLIHMPVPRDRADDAYFEPLRKLSLAAGTGLALGLVHLTDGIEGTRRRLATATRYVSEFAIATECGFGRRAPEGLSELLRIHAAVADLDVAAAPGKAE